MKDKTKQILRYVACGLGGLALGIGLLGGLSMCATSGNKQTENVNTILATRKNAITTNNGITSHYFEFTTTWNLQTDNTQHKRIFEFNPQDYSISLLSGESTQRELYSTYSYYTYLQEQYNNISVPSGKIYFLAIFGRGSIQYTAQGIGWFYFSFKCGSNTSTLEKLPMIETSLGSYLGISVVNGLETYRGGGNHLTYLPYSQNLVFQVMGAPPTTNTTAHFQDVESYYLSQGYSNGHTAGYAEGYDDAYAEKDSGIAFTSCGVYPNAHVTLATDETIGNFNYMYLCHYITKPGYDEHTIYILWTTHATTGQYLGQVIDRNDSNSYSPAVTLGSFSEQATSSVTITATQDMEFGLWVGYITTFHNRGEVTNSILWFQGGTSESDMQIYQNGYDEGYQNGNQEGQETGYEQGYERGQEVGDAEGYSRGYTEGFNQTNTKNVFSLFTSAFDSVASFFDLKIFGFLPLYWFFLAPLFIALISLLMRMVKH